MWRLFVLIALCALGCDERVCADTSVNARRLPTRLSDTGLFQSITEATLSRGVFAYEPEFELWSDGAAKQRWIWLPTGERIDNSAADEWRFPIGTKLWKEFSSDGVRLETRLLQKMGAADTDWAAVAYLWLADGSDALRVPYGALDVQDTGHDVPASGECWACHAGRRNRVLGFSQVQLAPRSSSARRRLDSSAAAQLFDRPVLDALELPGTPAERAALGYLHANCGHCHNQTRADADAAKCLDPNEELSFTLSFALGAEPLSSVAASGTYRTALGKVIRPGNAAESQVFRLMSARGAFRQMPPLGSDVVDRAGLELIRAWIEAL